MIVKGQVRSCFLLMIVPSLSSLCLSKGCSGKAWVKSSCFFRGNAKHNKISQHLLFQMCIFCILESVQWQPPPHHPHTDDLHPTPPCCLYIGALSVYYLLLCSLLLLQDKFPHRGNKAELNWNKRHSTTGSLATASWCKARAGRKCAHTYSTQTHNQQYALRQ